MWNWSFGDGSWFNTTLVSERNATHIYPSIGTYTVYLTVSNAVSTSTSADRTITVTPPPQLIADFTANTSSGTAPVAIQFTDTTVVGTPTMWKWSFGDDSWFNTTQTSERNATHVYTTDGIYTVYLTVSNAVSTSTSGGRTIAILLPPYLTATFTTNTSVGTAPLAVLFSDTSVGSTPTAWNWSFRNVTGNNTQVWFSTVQNPTLTFGVGNYSIVLNASNTERYALSDQVTFINVTTTPVTPVNQTTAIGVFRNGVWYLRNSNTNGLPDVSFAYGAASDVPVVGDWDGNGIDTVGIYRSGIFYLRNSNTNGLPDVSFAYGAAGDIAVVGDWDGL
jgi:PKD repeat protein